MLNRQWFYLTVCGNNSFTYVFHKCDPIPSQGRYKPTLSIEYNLKGFPIQNGSMSCPINVIQCWAPTTRVIRFWRMTTELPQNARDLDDVFCGSEYKSEIISLDPSSYFKHYGFRKRLWYVFHLYSRAFLLVVMFLLCFGHVYSHMCPQPAGHQIYFSNHSCMWVRWPPWPQPWHHTLRPFTIRWLQWVKI